MERVGRLAANTRTRLRSFRIAVSWKAAGFWAFYGFAGVVSSLVISMLTVFKGPEFADALARPEISMLGFGTGIAILQLGATAKTRWPNAVTVLGWAIGISGILIYLYSIDYEPGGPFDSWWSPQVLNLLLVGVAIAMGAIISGHAQAENEVDFDDYQSKAETTSSRTRRRIGSRLRNEVSK